MHESVEHGTVAGRVDWNGLNMIFVRWSFGTWCRAEHVLVWYDNAPSSNISRVRTESLWTVNRGAWGLVIQSYLHVAVYLDQIGPVIFNVPSLPCMIRRNFERLLLASAVLWNCSKDGGMDTVQPEKGIAEVAKCFVLCMLAW